MSFDVSVYDNVLIDLVAGSFTSTTVHNALLLTDAYTFSKSHVDISSVSSFELSGGGYARFTGSAEFTVAQVNDEIQYQVLTPAVSFGAFTASDWRYIITYNASTTKLYMCIDTGVTNVQAGTGFTLDPGLDPFLRLLAP